MWKKLFDLFRAPSAQSLALRELEESKRELLSAQSHAEYAVQLTAYNQARIKRLSAYLQKE